MKRTLIIAALVVLPFIPASLTGQDRILIPLVVRDNGGMADTLTFGFHANASYCIDGQIDSDLVEEEYPIGIPGTFDCRFMEHRSNTNCMGLGLGVHIQEFGKADTFRLRISPGAGGYPMVLSWPAGLDSVLEVLSIGVPGSLADPPYNWMLIDSTLTITNSSIDFLEIIGSVKLTGVSAGESSIPRAHSLSQNYPNPFNPTTQISCTLPSASHVSLRIFNVLGEEVATLLSERMEPGLHTVKWNAEGLSGGVYFYRLVAGKIVETRRMVFVK